MPATRVRVAVSGDGGTPSLEGVEVSTAGSVAVGAPTTDGTDD
jgi:hypothetical protein